MGVECSENQSKHLEDVVQIDPSHQKESGVDHQQRDTIGGDERLGCNGSVHIGSDRWGMNGSSNYSG